MNTKLVRLSDVLDVAFAEGCTQSEMTTLDNCGQLWFWRYGMLLRKKGAFSWATTFGSAMHQALEEMYSTQGKRWSVPDIRTFVSKGTILSTDQLKQLEYWQGVLRIQSECYAHTHRDDFDAFKVDKSELIVDIEFPFEGTFIRLKGMIDLTFATLQNGRRWMMDHKTSSRLDLKTVQGWDFRFQFMFYLWLLAKHEELNEMIGDPIAGYYINAIKKPTIKVRQGDTLDMFFERLRNEMLMEPEKYYYREKLLMNKDALLHFEKVILGPKLHRISLLTSSQVDDSIKVSIVNNMNTDYCQRYGVCEFLPLCAHGWELEGFQYEKRATKHEELEGEEE